MRIVCATHKQPNGRLHIDECETIGTLRRRALIFTDFFFDDPLSQFPMCADTAECCRFFLSHITVTCICFCKNAFDHTYTNAQRTDTHEWKSWSSGLLVHIRNYIDICYTYIGNIIDLKILKSTPVCCVYEYLILKCVKSNRCRLWDEMTNIEDVFKSLWMKYGLYDELKYVLSAEVKTERER